MKKPSLFYFKNSKSKECQCWKGENFEEGGSRRGGRIGIGKRVATGVRATRRFIFVKEVANFEEWTRKRRKIAPGHRVDLSNMEGMEIIPNLFEDIGWGPLHTINELYYPEMIHEFYANLHKGRIQKKRNITYQWVISMVSGRDIFFDDRLLNTILETPDDEQKMPKRSFKGNLQRSKRSLKTTRIYEDEVIKLNTLKTRRIVRCIL
ncbi:hypothetical protein M9H77_17871 [Catharanthus roseus]|uniref:Uncharacterized protein n=1 Tax=Catharanthus roseus TaxID=4058 RepID=A0ACC0B662_CATRO|nr:hypothetical protein M9H77_17871 [Catharanthus roseus]